MALTNTQKQRDYAQRQRALGRKKRGFFLNDQEFTKTKKFIKEMRDEQGF